MDDELGTRLQNLSDRAPTGTPDVGRVMQGGRWVQRRRYALRAVAGAAVVALGFMGSSALIDSFDRRTSPPATHEDGVFIPAKKGEPTYELYDFKIRYPWAPIDDARLSPGQTRTEYCAASEWKCGHRREQAGFSYGRTRWTTNQFPGTVNCWVKLYSAKGDVVGERELWGATSLGPTAKVNHKPVFEVRVMGRPVSAKTECEAGETQTGPGWRFTFVGSETYTPRGAEELGIPDRIRLIFDVEEVSPHTSARTCRMTVWFQSGRVVKGGWGTWMIGEGREEFETGYPASDPVEHAKITCRPIKG